MISILTKAHDHSKIFARDIDEIALKICFINLVLFFNNKNILSRITRQDMAFVENKNLLFDSGKEEFDFIVTNPPWGSKWTKPQKDYLLKLYPELETTDIFSIALYKAMTNPAAEQRGIVGREEKSPSDFFRFVRGRFLPRQLARRDSEPPQGAGYSTPLRIKYIIPNMLI